MAEETQTTHNWRLLVVAVALGLMVMVIYNMHIAQVRREGQGETVELIVAAIDIDEGTVIKGEQVIPKTVPRKHLKMLPPRTAQWSEKQLIVGAKALHSVRKGDLLTKDLVEWHPEDEPSTPLGQGMVSHTLTLDTEKTPGDILRVNSRVDVLAVMPSSTSRSSWTAARVIRGLRVITVGDKGPADYKSRYPADRKRTRVTGTYRKITVELKPDVSLQLDNVLSHRVGDIWVQVLPRGQTVARPGQIDTSLARWAKAAKPALRAAYGNGSR